MLHGLGQQGDNLSVCQERAATPGFTISLCLSAPFAKANSALVYLEVKLFGDKHGLLL